MWIELLKHAHDGVNLNLLTCHVPTDVLLADACPRLFLKSGRAWQIPLDPEIYDMVGKEKNLTIDTTLAVNTNLRLSNNLFEFTAQAMTIWLERANDDIEEHGSVLCIKNMDQSFACQKLEIHSSRCVERSSRHS